MKRSNDFVDVHCDEERWSSIAKHVHKKSLEAVWCSVKLDVCESYETSFNQLTEGAKWCGSKSSHYNYQ